MEAIIKLLDSKYHPEALGERHLVYRDDLNNRYIYLDLTNYNLEIVRIFPDDTEEPLYEGNIFNRTITEIENILNAYT